MFYVIRLAFNKNGEGVTKLPVISFISKERECRHVQFLEYKEVFDMYRDEGYDLKLLYDKQRKLPFIVLDSVSANMVDATMLFKFVNNGMASVKGREGTPEYANTMTKVCESLYEKIKDRLSLEEVKSFVEASLDFLKYWQGGSYTKGLAFGPLDVCSDFMTDTMEFINSVNSETTKVFTEITDAQNVTKFMEACTDDVFIKLPKWTFLKEDDLDYHTLLPVHSEICKPYSNPLWYTPQYNSNSRWTNYKDIIMGTEENSHNDIFPNEELYYHAIIDWAKFNMRQYFESEQYDILDPQSKEYFETLLEFLYSTGWGHNPLVPVYSPDAKTDDIDSDNGNYVFAMATASVNGISILFDFLEKASREVGWEVYPQAIVKLARWGKRKCSSLIFNGYDKRFNLNESTIERNIGDIRDYLFESRDLKCFIELGEFKDETYLKELGCFGLRIPVGVIAIERYKHPKKDLSYATQVYYPMTDLINLIKEGIISTIKYENGKFILNLEGIDDQSLDNPGAYVDLSLVVNNQSNASNKRDPFYRSEGLDDICFEFPTLPKDSINQLKIIYYMSSNPDIDFDGLLCKNKAEVIQAVNEDACNVSPVKIFQASIFNHMFPVYSRASILFSKKEQTLLNVLDAFDTAMKESSFRDPGDFYTTGIDKMPEKEEPAPKEMTVFGEDKDSSEDLGGNVVINKNELIEGIPGTDGFWKKMVRKSKDGTTVFCGYLFISRTGGFYVTTSAPDGIEAQIVSAESIARVLGSFFMLRMCGNNTPAKVKFTDENAMRLFTSKIR